MVRRNMSRRMRGISISRVQIENPCGCIQGRACPLRHTQHARPTSPEREFLIIPRVQETRDMRERPSRRVERRGHLLTVTDR